MRENPLAVGSLNTACKSVVGTGLSLRSEVDREVLGWSEDQAIAWQGQAERIFNMWARTKAADMSMTQDFWELQDLAFRTTLESGDALALFCYREHPSSPFGLAVQLVEGDRISNPNNAQDTSTLVAGVVLDGGGAGIAYHVADQHPGARKYTKRTWSPRPAFSASGRRIAQHLFVRLRPDQHRGVPYLSPVIETLRELGEYTDGELRAAVVSGLYTVFIEPPTLVDSATDEPIAEEGSDGDREVEMGYGVVRELEPGEKINTTAPGRPNVAFDPFVLALLRQVGVALEIPYEILVQHFTASYSAARAALLELAKFIRRRRAWLAANFCQPCYEALLEEAVATGRIDAPGFLDDPMKRLAYCGAYWIGDSLGQLDPLKEANAYKIMKDEFGVPESEAVAALTGGDWDRNIERRAYEVRTRRAKGVEQQAQANPGAARVIAPAEPDEPNPEEKDTEGPE
jgi:lambda family phage portal protein